ncbi:threonine synthase [Murimonas intestini]|uniref:Threonine synthase n=1 Tax=Murimonas intestini TaxID=1337051 RepID=A0AB73T9S7_9FIRM|nr:threonine synthase [Murimonas intestini]MCR1839241.1 threonine synthase [Murimonas intestini]MCR1864537.1 threonine synthase [Murimonas intestini]MCR1882147.1 threonine synthase [Murimonas intestini]
MELLYKSTRNSDTTVTASQAILKGLAEDGGLFVPTMIPKLDAGMDELAGMSYQETAYAVMKQYLTDFTEEELKSCIARAYDEKFDTEEIAPLKKEDGVYYLELFHGATIAFKDMALSILPHLMTTAAKKNHISNEIVILTATSGDTGKAALAGFADVPGTRIVVFYPKSGVSPIQEKQMVTQKGDNTFVVGIRGNFDDAQTGVKKIFGDKDLEKEMASAGFQFSSANSINIGRLVPQIVYYVYAYAKLYAAGDIKNGEEINVVVPTGNFGNILAAYYAKNMGVPIRKLICASNENRVLYDFLGTGTYDRNREFILTTSPSMDILISSNLERLLYRIAGEDDSKNRQMMEALVKDGRYEITEDMKEKLADFYGNYATEAETADEIAGLYRKTGYVLDTHTAVASRVYRKYAEETGDTAVTVIASTASPYKFTRSVMDAVDKKYDAMSDFELVDELNKISGVAVPRAIDEIRNAPVLHDTVVDAADMKDTVKKFLGI